MTTAAVVLAAGKGTRFKSGPAQGPACGRRPLDAALGARGAAPAGRWTASWSSSGTRPRRVAAEAAAAGRARPGAVEQTEQHGTGHAVRDGGRGRRARRHRRRARRARRRAAADARGAAAAARRTRARRPAVTLLTTTPARPARATAASCATATERSPAIVEERDATDRAARHHARSTPSIYAFAGEPLARRCDQLHAPTTPRARSTSPTSSRRWSPRRASPPRTREPGRRRRRQRPRAAGGRGRCAAQPRSSTAHMRRRRDGRGPRRRPTSTPTSSVEPDAVLLPGTHLEGATPIGGRRHRSAPTRGWSTREVEAGRVGHVQRRARRHRSGRAPPSARSPTCGPARGWSASAKAGAFVEMKNSTVGEGSKVPHLSYVGDTTIGRDANVGAATVTVQLRRLRQAPHGHRRRRAHRQRHDARRAGHRRRRRHTPVPAR